METVTIRAARPQLIRAIVATLVAVGGMVLSDVWGQIKDVKLSGVVVDEATNSERTLALIGAGIALLAGIAAVRSFGAAVRKGSEARGAAARGTSLAFVTSIIGYVILAVAILSVLRINVQGLLVGGAVTGVVVGIAAQQTIGNFFAGIVLLVVRPFTIGELVVLRSGPLGGEYEGTVVDMTLFYVHIQTTHGPVALPNAGVLASAVGPGARSATQDTNLPDDEPPV